MQSIERVFAGRFVEAISWLLFAVSVTAWRLPCDNDRGGVRTNL
jgi:hypothetical protein